MGYVHILCDNHTARPWWRADERWGIPPNKKVWCDCCNAYGRADEVEVCIRLDEMPILGDWGDYQYRDEPDLGFGPGWQPSYFDPSWTTRCGKGFGCTVKPRRRASAHLRER